MHEVVFHPGPVADFRASTGAGSRAGGERADAIHICKANGVEPEACIADVIAKVTDDRPASRCDELIPWKWQPQADPAGLAA